MLEGIFVPHITPFKEDESLDVEALRELVVYFNESGLDGLVTLGSNGEFPYLNFEEKLRVIEVVREASRLPVIAGTTENSTVEVIRLSRKAVDIGVDALIIAPPFYFKPSSEEIFKHYSIIAEKVDSPILLYNVPKFTGVDIDLGVIEGLADEHSNIAGIKDSGGSIGRITETVRRVGGRMAVMAGTADLMLPSFIIGAKGAIVAVANVAPHLCSELYASWQKGNLKRAAELQVELNHLNEIVVKKYYQISAIKAAMNILGLKAGYPRKPSLPLPDSAVEEIKAVLKQKGLLEV